jgi:hypothetical protein
MGGWGGGGSEKEEVEGREFPLLPNTETKKYGTEREGGRKTHSRSRVREGEETDRRGVEERVHIFR